MKKALFLGALALGTVACDPDIAQDPPPNAADVVVAEFDPSASPAVVPSPNDLAIAKLPDGSNIVAAPINPKAPAAEQEFTRDYLNTLNGFPTSAIATTLVKDLNPATVNSDTVKVIDLYEGTELAKPVTATIGYRPETNQITVIPPQPQGWPKGGRYAVAIIGGKDGVRTNQDKPIIASATWSFASSREPLVTCPGQDLASPDCRLNTELLPSIKTDPAERLADQLNSAKRLEQLRLGYKDVLNAVSAKFSVNRDDIVLAWTFSILNQPEATFDPSTSTIPFPNDLLRTPKTATAAAHLNLPVPPTAGTVQDLIKGLNTLDGWSTTATIISENSATRGVIDNDAKLDMNTVRLGKELLFVKLTPGGTTPKVKVCLNCASSRKRDGSAADPAPQQLQIIPEVPLDPATQYAVILLRGAKDEKGNFVAATGPQALMRLSSPLFVDGKSQVAAVPDGTAAALEPIRAGMKPLFDSLAANFKIERKDVLLAWTFTTQSTHTVLAQLNQAPTPVPTTPLYMVDQTAQLTGAMDANGLEHPHVGKALVGAFLSPILLDDVNGALNPLRPTRLDHIPFWLFLPASAPPATGYKVVVFGHGLGSNRTSVLPIVNKLNEAGYAVAAMDTVLHGERTSCAGITAASGLGSITTPDQACATGSTCDVTANSPTYGRCISASPNACNPQAGGDLACQAAGQGVCSVTTAKCEGGDFRRASASSPPLVSSWNFLNLTNLFATRDNFRHHVVDFSQLTRVLASDGLRTQLGTVVPGATLNAATVDYVGQSLGGFQGALSASVNTRVRRTVLNVPGGDLVDTLLTSVNPTFVARREGFLGFLESVGRVSGTPAFDEFIVLARTILDPAAPRNYGWKLENLEGAPAEREAFIQYIEGDEVIPNPVTQGLIAAANRDSTRTVQSYMAEVDLLPTQTRHVFLLISDPSDPGNPFLKSVRDTAQAQVVNFFNTGDAATP
ncbi:MULTISPECIES: hypothetical protein [Myxococcus]|uniref:Lipoprotein n=1 Tax=Myxococcus llanfairpwllgwyngyllgogerychwyrndrobwllllantysiliogogogochensis TaxID=2590453 RepID=A0A540X9J4_9BACT|nr:MULTISPECIES: hypothetical protein [Myxococcus]NTX02621.1 hypothetical protein [Myxococcus sp. CA040A]TQF17910.1 hypothetical protein FJV41_00760 [Myxococcus llanfairpwllgwyngyllgogerychwyrndrobwllllantysiliogogogochensis]